MLFIIVCFHKIVYFLGGTWSGAAATTSQLLLDPEVKAHVADSLRDKFRMLLKPLVVLPLFHKYDPNVLTQEDIVSPYRDPFEVYTNCDPSDNENRINENIIF